MQVGAIDQKTSSKMANMAIVCAVLVVVMHVVPRPSEGFGWYLLQGGHGFLCRIAVPYFFLAAGYFLAGHFNDEHWWGKELKKRVHSLLIPFFVFNVLFLIQDVLIWLVAVVVRGGSFADFSLLNINIILRCLGLNLWRTPYLGPLWFVRNLFILVLLAPALKFILDGRLKGFVALFLMFLVYGAFRPFTGEFPFHCTNTILCYGFSLEGLFYFALGLFLRMNKIGVPSGILVGCLCGCIALTLFGLKIFSILRGYVWQYYSWLSIPPLMVFVWSLVPSVKWPFCVVGNAFPVFLIHKFLVVVLVRIMWTGGWMRQEMHVFLYIVSIVIVISASFLCALLLRKIAPKASVVMFGGR